MRPFEISIAVLLFVYIIWPMFARRPRLVSASPALALLLAVLHVFIEGYRWQMLPLYALSVTLFLTGLPVLLKPMKPGAARVTGWALAGTLGILLVLGLSTAIPALLPVPASLEPGGPFTVGTRTFVLVNSSRKELYSGKDEPRKIMLEIWYPAVPPPVNTPPAAWMPEAERIAPAMADFYHLPSFFFSHLVLAKSSSYENIPANRSNGPYPVLVFSHGWKGFRQQSTFLMQELASHGYIVVAMEHTYGALLTVFPDDMLAPNNPNALPSGKPLAEYESIARTLVNQWSGDIGFALKTLAEWNLNDPAGQFTGLLQMEKVGVFGHSTGGGATIQFCGSDPRCKAGLTLDAFMRPVGLDVLDRGTRQPFFYMFSELWPFQRNTELFQRYYSHVDPSNRVVTLLGASHYDFSDIPSLSPLAAQMGLKGPIDGPRVQRIINTYALAFFDQQFKGKPTELFKGPQTSYPEVRYDH